MRPNMVLLTTIALLINRAVVREAAASDSGGYHIVFPRRAVGAGERVELSLEPPVPAGLRVNWAVVGLGNHMTGLILPVYRAPYVIPPGTPPAMVTANFSAQGVRAGASAEIELRPSRLPGAEGCLGPGEVFSTVLGDIELTRNFYVDTLPALIRRVEPVYPRSDFVRGVEDTFLINALVCRSGSVLDAYAVPRHRDRFDLEPIRDDPKLVEVAITAVRQYRFRPAKSGAQAEAVWVAVPVIFRD